MTTKMHTVYKTEEGKRVPSVTTIIGILNKPYLLNWVAEVTRNGDDWTKVRDSAADAGTLAHAMILARLNQDRISTDEYGKDTIKSAKNALDSYIAWEKEHKIKPLLVERPLVATNGLLSYGGTPDFYGYIDDELAVMDFKTGKGLYDEYLIQISAYGELLIENKFAPPKSYRLLRIGREEGKDFEEKVVRDVSVPWAVFTHCLIIYDLQKRLKGGK